jgi:hypothetical protein
MSLVPCPDGRPGCAVAHYGCRRCHASEAAEKGQAEVLAALQEANGLTKEGG